MLIQNVTLTRPAFIAPGMAATTALSTISMVRMDRLSAASTTVSAFRRASPDRRSGIVDRLYPNRKARAIERAMVAGLLNPAAVPMIKPAISPMAQPVRQWRVALMAMLVT